MAGIGTYVGKDGTVYKRLLFTDPHDGRRRTIRLGAVNKEELATAKTMAERLFRAKEIGTLDPLAESWLQERPPKIYDRFVRVGLAEPRTAPEAAPEPEQESEPVVRLGDFLDGYFEDRDDLKAGSLLVYGHSRRNLIEFFGREKAVQDVNEYDAQQWQRYLKREGLSPATVHKRTGHAKMYFDAAVRRRLIAVNPFLGLKSTSISNVSRQFFVDREKSSRVIEHCPDAQWRLIFALSRYGGLRCPSEHLALTWDDVDWDRGRLTIHSSKTAHHEGKATRVIPLFPEIEPYLREVFERAEPGSTHVITRYRQSNVNLRTRLLKILKRAGLEPWPRLFQNLRSSRETELCEEHPLHVVCDWIGNSQSIAARHYLQIRDSDFERALQTPADSATTVQRTVHSGVVPSRLGAQQRGKGEHAMAGLPAETGPNGSGQVPTGRPTGGGGIRTPVPRCFKTSVYMLSRSIGISRHPAPSDRLWDRLFRLSFTSSPRTFDAAKPADWRPYQTRRRGLTGREASLGRHAQL